MSCQSGALTFSFLSRGQPRQLKFTTQVSSGNQTVLEAHDYIEAALDSGAADIFLVYLEGIRQPSRFREVADKAAALGKPLIVADHLGPGMGQMIAFTEGSEAANPYWPKQVPVDAFCALIVNNLDYRPPVAKGNS